MTIEDNSELQQVVPEEGVTNAVMNGLEQEGQNDLRALESLSGIIAATKTSTEGLSYAAAKMAKASLERLGVQMHIPSKEAYAANPKTISQYALESLAEQEEGLFTKIFNFFKKWAMYVVEWVKSIATARGRANEALEQAKQYIVKNPTAVIPLKQGGFQARGFLPESVLSSKGLDAAVQFAPTAIDNLTAQMRDLVSMASALFQESPDTQEGIWKGVGASIALAEQFKNAKTFNMDGIAGVTWIISADRGKTTTGHDTAKFNFIAVDTTASVREDTLDGEVSVAKLRPIVDAITRSMTAGDLLTGLLLQYAKKINVMRATRLQNNGTTFKATLHLADLQVVMSLSSVLRKSVVFFDRVVTTSAMGCGRAVKYAQAA